MTADKKTRFTGINCLWMVAAVAMGAALAFSMTTWIFAHAPSDLERTSVLLDALENPELQPEFIVFGNSIVLSGIDTNVISESLPGKPLGLNLATTGQNPADSYLYYQNLPDSVNLILQFTLPRSAASYDGIEPQKYNAMYMYGYRPNDITRERLSNILGEPSREILNRSEFRQRFESRWSIQQTANNVIRGIARDDLEFDVYTYDLYFPNSGAKRLTEPQMQRALDQRYFQRTDSRYPYTEMKTALFKEAAIRADELDARFALVISPLHPSVHGRNTEEWFAIVRDYFGQIGKDGKFAIIDATDAVPEQEFVDALHVSRTGGKILSEFIAAEVMRLNLLAEH
jgi:hypothetical protein